MIDYISNNWTSIFLNISLITIQETVGPWYIFQSNYGILKIQICCLNVGIANILGDTLLKGLLAIIGLYWLILAYIDI